MDLFSANEKEQPLHLKLKDAELVYYSSFISSEKATLYFNKFLTEIPWQQDDIKLFGKVYAQPRLTALFGEKGKSYSYSGITMKPHSFTSELKTLKQGIEKFTKERFTTVLLNLYRDGSDSNGWHSDDEKELGADPFIASLSLGAKRTFQLRHKIQKELKTKIELEHGSLLTMGGTTQQFWKHQLPKSKRVTSARINLTFRAIEK